MDPSSSTTSLYLKQWPRSLEPDPLKSLAAQVAAKLEVGNFKGAVCLACSEDTVTNMSDTTHSRILMPLFHLHLFTISVVDGEVARAILSFPNGSAGGPDGLKPQHFKDLGQIQFC